MTRAAAAAGRGARGRLEKQRLEARVLLPPALPVETDAVITGIAGSLTAVGWRVRIKQARGNRRQARFLLYARRTLLSTLHLALFARPVRAQMSGKQAYCRAEQALETAAGGTYQQPFLLLFFGSGAPGLLGLGIPQAAGCAGGRGRCRRRRRRQRCLEPLVLVELAGQ